MVQKITANGQSIRKALRYTGCSKNIYYHQPKPREIKFDQQYWKRQEKLHYKGQHMVQGEWQLCLQGHSK